MKYRSINLPLGVCQTGSTILKLIPALLLTICCSCKKFVNVPAASNLSLQDAVFTNDQTAISAVSGLYSQMVALNLSMSNGGLSIYAGISSDELYNTSASSTYDPFSSNMLLSTNSVVSMYVMEMLTT